MHGLPPLQPGKLPEHQIWSLSPRKSLHRMMVMSCIHTHTCALIDVSQMSVTSLVKTQQSLAGVRLHQDQ